MRARDLAQDYESGRLTSDAMEAARLLAEHKLPGQLVLNDEDESKAILPASHS
ncbi:hypothetical protein ACIQU1_21555 [Streptomyces angustmyceticus]|uniref:hypothetical protein n=1 Tax=Streptomyces angustmyceticus TaxID=285578 RepID=UPI00381AC7FB